MIPAGPLRLSLLSLPSPWEAIAVLSPSSSSWEVYRHVEPLASLLLGELLGQHSRFRAAGSWQLDACTGDELGSWLGCIVQASRPTFLPSDAPAIPSPFAHRRRTSRLCCPTPPVRRRTVRHSCFSPRRWRAAGRTWLARAASAPALPVSRHVGRES